MKTGIWDKIRLSLHDEELLWELFHENSKLSKYQQFPSDHEVFEEMQKLHESLDFKGYPAITLPKILTPLKLSLEEIIVGRETARNLESSNITLENIATILHYSYGITRDNKNTDFPRPFRVVPSGGALYPLELFFYSNSIENYPDGIYHYNPSTNQIRLLSKGDKNGKISEAFVQSELINNSSLIIFITAVFQRSIFKYSDRGYRFILIEAGHVAQNINLVSRCLELGCVNLGGFFDRQIDELLGLDGVNHSTIYAVAVGKDKNNVQKK